MKIICITLTFSFCLFVCSNTLIAQNTELDSLEAAYNKATTDTAKLSVLLKKRYTVYLGQPDQLLKLYKSGYEIAQRLGNKPLMSKIALFTGATYAYGKSDEGTAFQWYQTATRIAEEAKDDQSCEAAYYALGIIYEHQGFKDKMYENFLKAFSYSQRLNTPSVKPLRGLMDAYKADGQLEKALAIAKKGVEIMDKPQINAFDQLVAYGDLFGIIKRIPNSTKQDKEIYLPKVNTLLDNIGLQQGSEELISIMNLSFDINRYDLVEKFGNQLLQLPDNSDFNIGYKADAHLQFAEMYEKLKNYPLSIQHWKQFTDIRVNTVKKAMTEDAGRKVIKAESERDLAIKQKEIEEQKLYILGISLVALLVLVLSGVAYYFYRREQKQKAELTRLNATKDRLFALLSHDLLSPIAYLKNIMMLVDWDLMSADEFKKTTKDLSNKVNNLYGMFENVLHWSISQMRGIKAKREKVNIKALIEEQIGLLEPIAKGKGITITHNIPSDFEWTVDKNHLDLILRNLLQNALKFTGTGGQISFDVSNTEGGKKLTLQDTGIGMPPEVMDKLFKVEQNAHREGTAKEGGTGLGLILTKELTGLNGGTIDVSSEVGKGTTFTLAFA